MKNYYAIALVLSGLYVCGCANTAEGMAEDAKNNSKAAQEGAQEAGKAAAGAASEAGKAVANGANELGKAASDAGNAAKLTPTIKSALIADSMLNDPANEIDVDVDTETVNLKGHVKDQKTKDRAEEITKKVLTDTKSTNKIKNDLEIK